MQRLLKIVNGYFRKATNLKLLTAFWMHLSYVRLVKSNSSNKNLLLFPSSFISRKSIFQYTFGQHPQHYHLSLDQPSHVDH